MVQLTQADLEFLFAQVTFDNADLLGPNDSSGIREVSGENNNLIPGQEHFGAADNPFLQMSEGSNHEGTGLNDYNDFSTPTGSPPGTPSVVEDAMPRIISNLISDQDNFIPNEAAIPGDLPFNSLMTYFGQFFDHGLDFVNKGEQGFIVIPVQPDDPLYDPNNPATHQMIVSRANVSNLSDAGADGIFGTTDDVHYDDNGTPGDMSDDVFSNPEHVNETSPFIDQNQTYGSDIYIRTFLKEYVQVGNVTFETGKLITGADGGLATWEDMKANALKIGVTLTDDMVNSGPPLLQTDVDGNVVFDSTGKVTVLTDTNSQPLTTGKGILLDINPAADPGFLFDGPGYDANLLDAHYVAGDGRINENFGLTAVHSVFHAEHNRVVDMIVDLLNQPGQTITMTPEQIFEAAKLVNEMEYQHLVFDEFARRVSPDVGEFDSYDTTIDASITGEFAHAVYRLGHSMLTEDIPLLDPTTFQMVGNPSLISAFLNPEGFDDNGAGSILMGLGLQVGNEIDEFVTDALRDNLLGQPLDLAAINIARGRDTGLPTLNEFREQLFAVAGDTALAPYTSWNDFGLNMKTPGDIAGGSLLNFIAAYAFGDVALAQGTAAARAQAQAAMANADFMNNAITDTNNPLYDRQGAFWDIDLWIGGLAEAKVLNGLLGSTFNVVFADQMNRLQDGDRFYYLERLAGTNILSEIEGENFSDLIMRNSDADFMHTDTFSAIDGELILLTNNDDTSGADRATFNDSEIIAGLDGNDTIDGGAGFDSIYGGDGNDTIEGGADNDNLTGGDGDDTLTDTDGDDFIRGNAGDDTIFAGAGADLVHGGSGDDEIHGGGGEDEIFGGTGNDHIFGDDGGDGILGGEGDDILEGNAGADRLEGEAGNDILIGGAGEDRLHGGDGDDILISGGGGTFNLGNLGERVDGGLGHDIASYETAAAGVTADLVNFLTVNTGEAQFDNYTSIEGLRGTDFGDDLRGDGLANTLEGGAGADMLNGRGGRDTAVYSNSDAAVQVSLAGTGSAAGGHAQGDVLSNIENLVGSDFDDTLTGRGGRQDLTGGGGNDTLDGRGGSNDRAIFSGNINDYTISGPIAPGGNITVADNRANTPDGTDDLVNIEFLQFADGLFAVTDVVSNSPAVSGPIDLGAIDEDGSRVILETELLAGAFDINGDPMTVENLGSSSGTFVLTSGAPGNRVWTFTPDADDDTDVVFSYDVSDGTNLTPQTANLDLTPVNDAPVAVADALTATEDTPVTFTAAQLVGNDTDIEGDTLVVGLVSNGTGGTVTLNGDGTVTFTPDANFNGPATFSYAANDGTANSAPVTVTVDVAPVNDAPVANADAGTTDEDTAITFTAAELLGNDTDVEGDTLTIASVAAGTGGTPTLNIDGSVTFIPDADFNGTADFTYVANDGTDDSAPATVTVTVNPVNDDPVANDDSLSATEDTPITYTAADLLGNDTDVDGDTLTIVSVTSGVGGTAGLNLDGSVTFTPDADFNGTANFTYVVNDGTVDSASATATVTVDPVNDTPVANADAGTTDEDTPIVFSAADLLGNDTDVDGDTLTIASVTSGTGGSAVLELDGSVTFTPDADFNGTADFTYIANDGTVDSAPATVTVTVNPVNDAPVASADAGATDEDTPVTFAAADLLGNDTDVEGDTLSIASVTSGTGGTAILNLDGTVTFTPDADFNGTADFTYVANDGTDDSAPATVTVTVNPVNDDPEIDEATSDLTPSGDEDTAITGLIVATDVDGDTLSYALAAGGAPSSGTVSFDGSGGYTYTGDQDFNGSDSFTVEVTDGNGGSDTVVVNVTVDPVVDGAVAQDDTLATDEATSIAGSVFDDNGNGADDNPDAPLMVTHVNGSSVNVGTQIALASGALLTLNGDGTFAYDPNGAFDQHPGATSGGSNLSGFDGFSYRLNDEDDANVTIMVNGLDGSGDIVMGTSGDDMLDAGIGNDSLFGLDGNDTLIGGLGNDLLDGGSGGDIMQGGDGNDQIIFNHADDRIIEGTNPGSGFDAILSLQTVNLTNSTIFQGGIEAATLYGTANANAIGNLFNNVLTGNDGMNVINGLAGADNMRGRGGSDTYVVDNVGDIVDESIAGSSGFDRVLSSVTVNFSNTALFRGALERIELTGTADVNATGNLLANSIVGNSGNNIINGLAGSDVLTGGMGTDAFVFSTALGVGNVDIITDYHETEDQIWLDDAVFTALGPIGSISSTEFRVTGSGAQDSDDYLLYNQTTGALYYDADANGAGAAVAVAMLSAGTVLDSDDFLIV